MMLLLLLAVGLIESVAVCGALFWYQRRISVPNVGNQLTSSSLVGERKKLLSVFKSLLNQTASGVDATANSAKLEALREDVRVDKGRVAITYAELEALEARLRELHEIERELKASGLETQEELKILQLKEQELRGKNDALKEQLEMSLEKLDELSGELEMNAELEARVQKMKNEITQCYTKTDQLLVQIEDGNNLYVKLKRRYDALDIEYAQLYEKFSDNPPTK